MERTIRVTGRGRVELKPDTVCLQMEMSGMEPVYEMAVQTSAEQTEKLKDLFVDLGFDRKDLRTTRFDINTKYESYRAKDDSWQRRFLGYEYSHSVKISFPADNKVLGRVLYGVAHSTVKPEVDIDYTVANAEAAKNELLGNAIADSVQKAKVLTKAAGVNLGDILTIDYSWGEIEFRTRPVDDMVVKECCESECVDGSYDIDIDPDDIRVSDTVTVVWSIH